MQIWSKEQMCLWRLLTLIATVMGQGAFAVVYEELEERNFTQNIVHPAVTADSEIDPTPFVPYRIKLPIYPKVVNTKCQCGVHDFKGNQERPFQDLQVKVNLSEIASGGEPTIENAVTVKDSTQAQSLDDKVSGEEKNATGVNQFVWIVALVYRQLNGTAEHFCGGTLISSKLVLTATHCFLGRSAAKTEVWINKRDLLLSTESPYPTLKMKVSRLVPHPQYHKLMLYNDIALLELSESVDIEQSHLRPICLPEDHNYDPIKEGVRQGITAGWGRTSFEGPKSSKLLHVNVDLYGNQECLDEAEPYFKARVTDHMICAGDIFKGGRDACPGDSGGPLFVERKNKQYQLIGIVSWGDRCAEPRKPGIYTFIPKYIKWIESIEKDMMGQSVRCAP